jgi:hypothetical protein
MTVQLITALQAAETLAAYHVGRIEQTVGLRQTFHDHMRRRCLEDIDDIKKQPAAGGVTAENQARAMRSTDAETAQRIVAHLPPEWRASEKAPKEMEALAQAIADAMQTARGGTQPSAAIGTSESGPGLPVWHLSFHGECRRVTGVAWTRRKRRE